MIVTRNRHELTITEMFADQVRRRPHSTALTFGDEDMTYGELDERADRLARRLRSLGVVQESVVGVCIDRSFEMVIALVAILKAGGAYLPVHPAEPAERFCYMLEQADAGILLTHERLAGSLPEVDATVLSLDAEPDPTPAGGPQLVVVNRPDNLAYVCYTSGSTGRPKGVCVPHRGVVRLVRDRDYADLGPDETFLQLCTLTFDPAAFEIWGALCNGGRLVIHPPGTLSLPELADCIEQEKVTTLWLTTGLFHRMVEGQLDHLGGLRQLLAGGDALSPAHVNRVRRTYPELRLINGYGPTENTCFTTCHEVTAPVGESVPIGRAITDTRVYVLDEKLAPVPDGEWGLLYTGGGGLARGYLGRPGYTATRFLPDPFHPGERMYAVGDVVRRCADGVLEFRGRVDDQVKVGGYRVELGEILAVLAGHPGVLEAVVVARDDVTPGQKVLLAYVVADDVHDNLVPELRVSLHLRLPRYMNPAAIILMDELPLTRNGKIDRAALPAPAQKPRSAAIDYTAPGSPVEALLADLWADALSVEQVGIHDDFFEIGGDSLIAADLLTKISETLEVSVPAAQMFFRNATVAGLAEIVGTDITVKAKGVDDR